MARKKSPSTSIKKVPRTYHFSADYFDNVFNWFSSPVFYFRNHATLEEFQSLRAQSDAVSSGVLL